ncbi:hypothetical protein LEN26_020782 [Aphanomyces euteiches]|nr:hypothetical protein LEN26_020782 [Aphanomyces euteiches]KAH9123106.1 hypothetical protein AeMF1_005828 [Aphanomyces euteiches]
MVSNDGPAVRASSFIRFSKAYLAKGGLVSKVVDLHNGTATGVIKNDIAYVISKYSDSNGCDLWEEQRGLHFFTVAVQRRAIYEVCDFANFLSDATSAATYAAAATNLDAKLTTFWNANAQSVGNRPLLWRHLRRVAESVFRAATAYVKAGSITVTALNQKLFNAGAPGTTQFTSIIEGLKAYGDKHIRRVKLHGAAGNHFNEQFNRNTGVAQGVNDLTWSYAALISTNNARAELKALSP